MGRKERTDMLSRKRQQDIVKKIKKRIFLLKG